MVRTMRGALKRQPHLPATLSRARSARAATPKICRPLRNTGLQTPITDHHPREVTCRAHLSPSRRNRTLRHL
jgi:hypothetical protein